MKLAFILYNYFPFGGLQRDFLKIAEQCINRGHQLEVHTLYWRGERPSWLKIKTYDKLLKRSAYKRNAQFNRDVMLYLSQHPVDLKVGFNKMPGLDVYYAADTCYEEKARRARSWLYRLTPRYKHYSAFENATFGTESKTKILLIADGQKTHFKTYYKTPDERFFMLPPGISQNRRAPENALELRKQFRETHDIADKEFIALLVGSDFKRKGADRAIKALATLPAELLQKTHLFIVGDDNPKPYQSLASKVKLKEQVRFFPGTQNVLPFFLGSDLLVHPAYNEAAGIVLLEALVAGLPVLCTDICGYASYITKANSGTVLESPFSLQKMKTTLEYMLTSNTKEVWKKNSLAFANTHDLYSLPEKATAYIETIAKDRGIPK